LKEADKAFALDSVEEALSILFPGIDQYTLLKFGADKNQDILYKEADLHKLEPTIATAPGNNKKLGSRSSIPPPVAPKDKAKTEEQQASSTNTGEKTELPTDIPPPMSFPAPPPPIPGASPATTTTTTSSSGATLKPGKLKITLKFGSSESSDTSNLDSQSSTTGEDDSSGGPPPPPGGPPPPPPGPGGAPPPPPGAGPVFKGIKLKRFNWSKIPPTKIGQTIFGVPVETEEEEETAAGDSNELGDGEGTRSKEFSFELDTKVLEDHFALKSGKVLTQKKKEKTVQILDFKRANTVGILISRLRLPVEDMIGALLALDEKKLSLDNTRALLKLAPTDDEVLAVAVVG
jgi:hypothetical protein